MSNSVCQRELSGRAGQGRAGQVSTVLRLLSPAPRSVQDTVYCARVAKFQMANRKRDDYLQHSNDEESQPQSEITDTLASENLGSCNV